MIKRIYKLKMGSKQEMKDPTVALENQRRAQETVDFMTKSSSSSQAQAHLNIPQSKVSLTTHLDNLKNNILYDMNPN